MFGVVHSILVILVTGGGGGVIHFYRLKLLLSGGGNPLKEVPGNVANKAYRDILRSSHYSLAGEESSPAPRTIVQNKKQDYR